MGEIDIFYVLFYGELFLLSVGVFLWGYRTGIKHAKEDMEKILEEREGKNEIHHKTMHTK